MDKNWRVGSVKTPKLVIVSLKFFVPVGGRNKEERKLQHEEKRGTETQHRGLT